MLTLIFTYLVTTVLAIFWSRISDCGNKYSMTCTLGHIGIDPGLINWRRYAESFQMAENLLLSSLSPAVPSPHLHWPSLMQYMTKMYISNSHIKSYLSIVKNTNVLRQRKGQLRRDLTLTVCDEIWRWLWQQLNCHTTSQRNAFCKQYHVSYIPKTHFISLLPSVCYIFHHKFRFKRKRFKKYILVFQHLAKGQHHKDIQSTLCTPNEEHVSDSLSQSLCSMLWQQA